MIKFKKKIATDLSKAQINLEDIEAILSREVADKDHIFRIKLCLYEAVANCFEHGNQWDVQKSINLYITIKKGLVVLRVYDEGSGIKSKNHTQMPKETKKSGRGLVIISEVADYVYMSTTMGYIKIKFLI